MPKIGDRIIVTMKDGKVHTIPAHNWEVESNVLTLRVCRMCWQKAATFHFPDVDNVVAVRNDRYEED